MKKIGAVLVAVAVLLTATAGGVAAFPAGQWVSGVTVANLSGDPAAVWITFYNQDGTVALDFDGGIIPGNGAKTWYLPSHVPGLPDSFVGSAVVESDQPIAAIVNTQLPSGTDPARVGTSVGVDEPATSTSMYAPQLMKDYWGWNSYCAVQNTGDTAADITVRYFDAAGVEVDSDTQNIAGYASYIFDQSDDTELGGGVYSAKFEGDAGHPIAVVCNFYNDGSSANNSQFHSYNGLSQGGDTV